jgi:hypothetical protein
MNMDMKQQEMDWRRSKVLELSSQGYSEREISEVLKLNDTAVHRDLVYLRKEAQENLRHHIHEVVPEEYQKCMVGMKRNLKQTLEIAETASDPRSVRVVFLFVFGQLYPSTLDYYTTLLACILPSVVGLAPVSDRKSYELLRVYL